MQLRLIAHYELSSYLKIKMGHFNIFSSFEANITIFNTNNCEKMSIQDTVLGFEPTTFATWDSCDNH